MVSLPSGWFKKKDTKTITIYEEEKNIIYLWKSSRAEYMVEYFKKAIGYKTRMLSQNFSTLKEATKFCVDLMKQKRFKKTY